MSSTTLVVVKFVDNIYGPLDMNSVGHCGSLLVTRTHFTSALHVHYMYVIQGIAYLL